jgi:hypothetical protein
MAEKEKVRSVSVEHLAKTSDHVGVENSPKVAPRHTEPQAIADVPASTLSFYTTFLSRSHTLNLQLEQKQRTQLVNYAASAHGAQWSGHIRPFSSCFFKVGKIIFEKGVSFWMNSHSSSQFNVLNSVFIPVGLAWTGPVTL